MIHILVTGSSGQLGRSLQRLASSYPDLSFYFTSKADLDISDREAVSLLLRDRQFDFCINCAAYTNVEQAEKTPHPAFVLNEKAVANLAEVCKEEGITLIHISTDYVFDGEKEGGYRPGDKPNPINMYGKSKWEGEKRISEILDRHIIIRTSWLYSEDGDNFYTKIRKKAEKGGEIEVTKEQTGCPTHVDNLAKYILRLISGGQSNYGIHHFTDGEAMTWFEFANRILIQLGLTDRATVVEAKNYRTFAARPKYSILKP